MGMLDVPKALYKAQQAKKRMEKIRAAGAEGAVSVLMNGLGEIEEVEIDRALFAELIQKDSNDAASTLEDQIKKAIAKAKKELEKQLMSSTDLNDLKSLLGGQ